MSQKRTIKTDEDSKFLNELLNHLKEKYEISDIILNSINNDNIKYKLKKYNIQIDEIDLEIEAINMNLKEKSITIETIKEAINQLIKRKEENEEQNKLIGNQNQKNNKIDSIKLLHKDNSASKKAPAKKNNITIKDKINVKYNTNIVYNEGGNQMEKKFNEMNPELNEQYLKIIEPYDLLPKDFSGQKDGYLKYFSEIKEKFLNEPKINKDPLLEENKFVLFLAFDIIDDKPSFEDLVGIDPLDDYKKYALKIDINNNEYFLVSGQIIYIEGDKIDNGKTIEVRYFKNIYEINEYNVPYEQIAYFYEKSSDPYAIYCMNGPYFQKDNTDLSVFNDVIKQVVFKDPHFFIINGPFFSSENEKVKWGEVDTEEGMKEIINILKKEFINTRTKILICPGISDIENFYPIPQPPFDKINDSFKGSKIGKDGAEIIFISNPQIFQLNEVFIGIANFDTIKDTIMNSLHSELLNTVDKACEMILYQKNFYPILPNTIMQNYEDNQDRTITVDLSQYKYLNFDNYDTPPDIILTNSLMKTFAKKIHGTVFINCGSFVKGKNYGEIAKITLHNAFKATDIYKRLKVEFININPNQNLNNNNSKK